MSRVQRKRKRKRILAGFLAFCLTFTSTGGNVWAGERRADITDDSVIRVSMDSASIRAAAEEAIQGGFENADAEIDPEDIGLAVNEDGVPLDQLYEALFSSNDKGAVYEFVLKLQSGETVPGETGIRAFVRAEAVSDYRLTGKEQVIFLFANYGEDPVVYQADIDGKTVATLQVNGSDTGIFDVEETLEVNQSNLTEDEPLLEDEENRESPTEERKTAVENEMEEIPVSMSELSIPTLQSSGSAFALASDSDADEIEEVEKKSGGKDGKIYRETVLADDGHAVVFVSTIGQLTTEKGTQPDYTLLITRLLQTENKTYTETEEVKLLPDDFNTGGIYQIPGEVLNIDGTVLLSKVPEVAQEAFAPVVGMEKQMYSRVELVYRLEEGYQLDADSMTQAGKARAAASTVWSRYIIPSGKTVADYVDILVDRDGFGVMDVTLHIGNSTLKKQITYDPGVSASVKALEGYGISVLELDGNFIQTSSTDPIHVALPSAKTCAMSIVLDISGYNEMKLTVEGGKSVTLLKGGQPEDAVSEGDGTKTFADVGLYQLQFERPDPDGVNTYEGLTSLLINGVEHVNEIDGETYLYTPKTVPAEPLDIKVTYSPIRTTGLEWRRSDGKDLTENEKNRKQVPLQFTWEDIESLECKELPKEEVWDGRYSANYSGCQNRTLDYDYATWENPKTDKHDIEEGNYEIRRFQTTFKVSDETSLDNPMIRMVSANGKEGLALDDDVFIFVYKEGTQITDDNYLNYLAFWGGTRTFNGNPSFHGITGTQSVSDSQTGWRLVSKPDNIGRNIIKNYGKVERNTNYVIDMFTTDYSCGGLIEAMDLEFEERKNQAKVTIDYYLDTISEENWIRSDVITNLKVGQVVNFTAIGTDNPNVVDGYATIDSYKYKHIHGWDYERFINPQIYKVEANNGHVDALFTKDTFNYTVNYRILDSADDEADWRFIGTKQVNESLVWPVNIPATHGDAGDFAYGKSMLPYKGGSDSGKWMAITPDSQPDGFRNPEEYDEGRVIDPDKELNNGDTVYVVYTKLDENSRYHLRYDSNLPESSTESVTGMPEEDTSDYKYQDKVYISQSVPEREGYEFLGWTMDKGGTGTLYTTDGTDQFDIRGDVVLYAQWQQRTTPILQFTYTVNHIKEGEAAPFKTHNHTIKGFSEKVIEGITTLDERDTPDLMGYSVSSIQPAIGSVAKDGTVFTVLYKAAQYHITYDSNSQGLAGGSVEDSAGYSYHSKARVKENGYLLLNNRFIGWNTKPDGSGTGYDEDAEIVMDRNLTLYAQWTPVTSFQLQVRHRFADGEEDASVQLPADTTKKNLSSGYKETVKAGSVPGYVAVLKGQELAPGKLTASKEIEIRNSDITETFIYYKDSIKEGSNDDARQPDQIPDRFQIAFTYKAEVHGRVDGNTFEVQTRPLVDGKYSDITPAYPRAQVTVAADGGYFMTQWSSDRLEVKDSAPGNTFADVTNIRNAKFDGDTVFTSSFGKTGQASYRVELYYEEKGVYPASTGNVRVRTGEPGAVVTVSDGDRTPAAGYILDASAGNIESGTIRDDGSLVLKLYFRQQFQVRYLRGDHGTFEEQTHLAGYNAPVPGFQGTITGDRGYRFVSWSPANVETVTGNIDFVAQWRSSGGGSGGGGGGTTPTPPVTPPSTPDPANPVTPPVPPIEPDNPATWPQPDENTPVVPAVPQPDGTTDIIVPDVPPLSDVIIRDSNNDVVYRGTTDDQGKVNVDLEAGDYVMIVIDDENVPLAQMTFTIGEEATPLGGLPKTGEESSAPAWFLFLSGWSGILLVRKKRHFRKAVIKFKR